MTDEVLAVFTDDPAVSHLAVLRGASLEPVGDIVMADVAREAANELIDRLDALGIPESGTIHIEPVTAYTLLVPLTEGFKAEQVAPALTAKISTLPDQLRRTLTWDQGVEMRDWKQVQIAADIAIYFCDSRSRRHSDAAPASTIADWGGRAATGASMLSTSQTGHMSLRRCPFRRRDFLAFAGGDPNCQFTQAQAAGAAYADETGTKP